MLPPDNPWPVVLVLLCVAIGFGLSWYGSRKRSALAVSLIALGLAAGCYAWSETIETPSKQIVRNLHEMVAAFEAQDAPKVLSYFSPQANIPPGLEAILSAVKVNDHLRITDVSVRFKQQDSLAILHFRANGGFSYYGTAVDHFATRWELEWQREANIWKIINVRRLHLMNGSEVSILTGK